MKDIRQYYEDYWLKDRGNWSPRSNPLLAAEIRVFGDNVKPGTKMMDVGCGDGRLSELARRFGVAYSGIDLSSQAVEACREKGLEAVQHDLSEPFPFPNGTFEAVSIFEVFEHLFSPDLVLSEIVRVLKPGGVVIGSVPNIAYFPNRLLLLAGRFNPGGSPDTSLKRPWADPHLRFFSYATTRNFLATSPDLEQIRLRGYSFDLTEAPVLYKLQTRTREHVRWIFAPLGALGHVWPSAFSHRVLFSARKRLT